MPCSRPKSAAVRVSPNRPAFVDAYEAIGLPKQAAEPVLTMRPPPCATMCGQAARIV